MASLPLDSCAQPARTTTSLDIQPARSIRHSTTDHRPLFQRHRP